MSRINGRTVKGRIGKIVYSERKGIEEERRSCD